MNRQRKGKVAGRGVNFDSVQITTSHSIVERDRSKIFSGIDDSLVSGYSRKSDRHIVSSLDTELGNFFVDIQIESTDSAIRFEDEFPKERDDSVDTLRIKIRSDISEKIETPLIGVIACKDVLEDIEETLPWITAPSSLSVTLLIESAEFEYRHEIIQGMNVEVFDEKIRVRDVPRANLEHSLSALSTFTN